MEPELHHLNFRHPLLGDSGFKRFFYTVAREELSGREADLGIPFYGQEDRFSLWSVLPRWGEVVALETRFAMMPICSVNRFASNSP
jgi:hypothetical protein